TDGTGVTVTLPYPGQKGLLTFTGVQGHRYSLYGEGLSGCLFQPATITRPSGELWKTGTTCGNVFIEPDAAPSSGTYAVTVDPSGPSTGSARMYVYDVSDLTGSFTLNAAAVPVSIGQRGQAARYAVDVPAGQVTVRLTNNLIGGM